MQWIFILALLGWVAVHITQHAVSHRRQQDRAPALSIWPSCKIGPHEGVTMMDSKTTDVPQDAGDPPPVQPAAPKPPVRRDYTAFRQDFDHYAKLNGICYSRQEKIALYQVFLRSRQEIRALRQGADTQSQSREAEE